MKTHNQSHYARVGETLLRRTLGMGLAMGLMLPIALCAGEAAGDDGKDYALFVGDDLSVRSKKGLSPIVGVEDDSIVVRDQSSTKKVPLRAIEGFQYQRGVKLSSLFANVGDPKISYSNEAADRAWFEAASVQMNLHEYAASSRDAAGATLRRGVPIIAQNPEAIELATAEMVAGIDAAGVAGGVANLYGQKVNIDTAMAGADTLRVTFELSSPQPLDKGYVALITEYKANDKEGAVQQGISVTEFNQLDSKPRKFKMRQKVLQGAWSLKSYRIAVYSEGQEVATNLSERRTTVTKDEAHRFFLLQYLLTNKGQTRGPSMIPMRPKQELKAAARDIELPDEIFVKVDKNGALLSLSTDRSGEGKVSPACDAFLENMRFLPALDDGKPVEGSARVALAALVR